MLKIFSFSFLTVTLIRICTFHYRVSFFLTIINIKFKVLQEDSKYVFLRSMLSRLQTYKKCQIRQRLADLRKCKQTRFLTSCLITPRVKNALSRASENYSTSQGTRNTTAFYKGFRVQYNTLQGLQIIVQGFIRLWRVVRHFTRLQSILQHFTRGLEYSMGLYKAFENSAGLNMP